MTEIAESQTEIDIGALQCMSLLHENRSKRSPPSVDA